MKKTKINIPSINDFPEVPASWGGMLWNETGTWRFAAPLFSERPSPCTTACPLKNGIPRIMHLVKERERKRAWETFMWENPFPQILGRVCPAFCALECNRGDYDEVIGIRDIERKLGDDFSKSPLPVPKRGDTNKSVGIVGSGPAGLSAAYFLTLLGHKVTIFEGGNVPGGIIRHAIPDYRLPSGVVDETIGNIKKLGVEFRLKHRVGVDVALDDLKKDFDAIFVSPGASVPIPLKIEGEGSSGVKSGIGLLRKVKAGQAKKIEGKIAVIGGGNTALDVARSILRLGGEPVIIYRRTVDEMPAFSEEIEEANDEGIPMEFLKSPVKISQKDGGGFTLTLTKMKLGQPDESGRRRPVTVEGSQHTMEVFGVVTAVGEEVDLSFIEGGGDASTQDKIILGGDAAGIQRSVAHAAASGKRGAILIDSTILNGESLSELAPSDDDFVSFENYFNGSNPEISRNSVPFEDINIEYFEKGKRAMPKKLAPEILTKDLKGTRDFSEIAGTLSTEDLTREASRCFVCGTCIECGTCESFCPDFTVKAVKGAVGLGFAIDIDYTYCKGCGICVRECPRGMFTMVEEDSIEELKS